MMFNHIIQQIWACKFKISLLEFVIIYNKFNSQKKEINIDRYEKKYTQHQREVKDF